MTAPLLTVPEVAERVRLSREAVYRAIRDGDLRAIRLRSRLLVEPDALERWIEASIVQPQEPEQRPRRRPRRRQPPPATGTLTARLKALEGGSR